MDLNEIGRRIRAARVRRRLTQEELAHKLGYSAANPVSKLESGKVATVDVGVLKRIGQLTDTWMPYLLLDTETVRPYGSELKDSELSANSLRFDLRALHHRLQSLAEPPGLEVPLLGNVQAGALDEVHAHAEAMVSLPDWWRHSDGVFLLRVAGDSMSPTLLNGDLAVVHVTKTLHDGDVAVVVVDREATVKRFRRRGDRCWLAPDNVAFASIELNGPYHVNGRVVGLLRVFEGLR